MTSHIYIYACVHVHIHTCITLHVLHRQINNNNTCRTDAFLQKLRYILYLLICSKLVDLMHLANVRVHLSTFCLTLAPFVVIIISRSWHLVSWPPFLFLARCSLDCRRSLNLLNQLSEFLLLFATLGC